MDAPYIYMCVWLLQFVLPVTWSYGKKYGVSLEQLASWWSERPAKLAGQELKVLRNIIDISFRLLKFKL